MSISTLSEVYEDLHNIIPLDFDSVRTVPHSHFWQDRSDELEPSDRRISIPLVDLADPDAARLVGEACETWGVFRVRNHDIPLKLLHEVEGETSRLFSLPASDKLKVLRSPGGAAGYGAALISKFFDKHMWHEGFTIRGSPLDHAKKLWPCDYQGFCDVMEECKKKMEDVAVTLMQLILNFLDISSELSETSQLLPFGSPNGEANYALQLNSYPPCPNPNRAMGLALHTDTSLFTILHQTGTNGLQVFKESVGWVLVCPEPGELVVNVGDFLHILSNARFPSVLHRVVMTEASRQRLSVAYFYIPPVGLEVSPAGGGGIPLYRPVSVGEYMEMKSKHLEKALNLIRI